MNERNLHDGFFYSSEQFADRVALEIADRTYLYHDLKTLALQIAAALTGQEKQGDSPPNPLVGVFALRSLTAYAGVLGTLAAGKGYVPLHPRFPIERTLRMFDFSGVNSLLVGSEALNLLEGLLNHRQRPLIVISPEILDFSALSSQHPQHRFIDARALEQIAPLETPVQTSASATAYLLFTSGSTGMPKGVPVSHSNVTNYVAYIASRYEISEHDRFSQTFDPTFDLSVHDMFVCWERGACLCSLPESAVMGPGKFIRDKRLTHWFSVPSVAVFMSKLGMLKPDTYPSLRCSLFCGEPLPGTMAEAWQQAAPNSLVENLYGPTEATIAISHYRWNSAYSMQQCINGVTPIGSIFSTQKACVIDSNRQILPTGSDGELCLGGSQVTRGYLNNPEKTREQFIQLPNSKEIWYRTGDLVRKDDSGCLYYLGRIDEQVQIRGYRVELQEIDGILRRASGCETAVAVAWPIENGRAEGIYGYLSRDYEDRAKDILSQCANALPEYMVPRQLIFIDGIPRNANGKIDRKKLTQELRERFNG